jgi:hypothetical protein
MSTCYLCGKKGGHSVSCHTVIIQTLCDDMRNMFRDKMTIREFRKKYTVLPRPCVPEHQVSCSNIVRAYGTWLESFVGPSPERSCTKEDLFFHMEMYFHLRVLYGEAACI